MVTSAIIVIDEDAVGAKEAWQAKHVTQSYQRDP